MTKSVVQTNEVPLPEPVARRGINEAQWRTLCNSLYPGADPQSVLMVVDYCQARKLDVMKKPCHIVPMYVKDQRSGNSGWRDVVMPGIYEYRTTAQRTKEYLGHTKPEYGESINHLGVDAPEWCEMAVKRWNPTAKQSVEFPVRVYFREICATKKDRQNGGLVVNDRWSKAPIQMLTKCTEAAALREAFPDELGGETTYEEMVDQQPLDMGEATVVSSTKPEVAAPKRASEQEAPEPEYDGEPPDIATLRDMADSAGWPEQQLAKVVHADDFDSMNIKQRAKAARILAEAD